MTRERLHFIVLVDRATPEEQLKVTNHFEGLDAAWWHYFQDSWLVVLPAAKGMEEDQIARDLQEVLGRTSFLVLRGTPILGSGNLPTVGHLPAVAFASYG